MEIARERFLDESRLYHVTLTLRSRTTEMHSVLTALSTDERDAVGAVPGAPEYHEREHRCERHADAGMKSHARF